MKDLLELIRGLTRPLVTLALVGILCAIVVRLVWSVKSPELPAEVWVGLVASFTTAVTAALAFWFSSRNKPTP